MSRRSVARGSSRSSISRSAQGIAVTRSQQAHTQTRQAELASVHGFAQAFLPGGQAPQAGELFRQPRLGGTLRHLAARGLDDFYLELSTRGDSEKFIGSDEEWASATETLRRVATESGRS